MSGSLHAALVYAARGFSVIPTNGKEPHFGALREIGGSPGWSRYTAAPASSEEIQAWYEIAPEAGVAIITGTASGIVVADVEHQHLRDPAAARILHTQTPVATTPNGGRHAYFASPTCAFGTRRTSWGDLKAEGGYVVAPPDGLRRDWLVSLIEAPLASAELLEELATPEPLRGILPLEVSAAQVEEAHAQALLDRLADWDARPEYIEAVAAYLGIPAQVGLKFHCVLPQHQPDKRPSANLWRNPENGHVLYRCWHKAETRPLHFVYAMREAGTTAEIAWTRSIHAVWKLRLLHVTGLVRATDTTSFELPPSFPNGYRRFAQSVELLFDVRSLSKLGPATTMTPEFLAPWAGCSPDTAKELRHALRSADQIHRTGEKYGRADLYLPGPAPRGRHG